LDDKQGFQIAPAGYPDVGFDIGAGSGVFEDLLNDRPDGIALLAETLAHSHMTGRLVEFVRFFERAFGVQQTHLIETLSRFLRGSKLGYTKKEVRFWIQGLRNPAVHGRMNRVVYEADVRPVIARVEQAAYDVLFNKVEWGTTSMDRRSFLFPPTGITSRGVYVKKGAMAALKFQLLDDHGVYPLDLSSRRPKLPEGWWSPRPHARVQQMSGVLEIVD